jgi:hypothetical protein
MSLLFKSLYVTRQAIAVCKVPTHNKGQHEQGFTRNVLHLEMWGALGNVREIRHESLHIVWDTHISWPCKQSLSKV